MLVTKHMMNTLLLRPSFFLLLIPYHRSEIREQEIHEGGVREREAGSQLGPIVHLHCSTRASPVHEHVEICMLLEDASLLLKIKQNTPSLLVFFGE